MNNSDKQPKILRGKRSEASGNKRDPELGRKTLKARRKLYDLIVEFRMDATNVGDPRAQALFELSAEMLAAMARAFREYDENPKSSSVPSGA